MIEQLNRLQVDWRLVEGIDCQSLTSRELTSFCDPISFAKMKHYLTPGAIGCMLSHQKALQLIVSEGYRQACILEDDLLLPDNFTSILGEIGEIATDSEVILLYWLSFEKQLFARQTAVTLKNGYQVADSRNSNCLLSAVGYVVSKHCAIKLIESNQPIQATADSWGYFLSRGAVKRVRCLVPSPIELATAPSEILLRSGRWLSKGKFWLEMIFPTLNRWAHKRRKEFYRQSSRFDWV
jgi:glycosyl transferase family 25